MPKHSRTWGERALALYAGLVLRHPRRFLLLLTLAVAALATQIPEFKLDASADSLVLEGDEALEYFREVHKRYDAEDFLLVTYTPDGDLFSDPVLGRIKALRNELSTVSGVSSVVSILDVPLLYSPKVPLSEIARGLPTLAKDDPPRDLVRREFRNSPIYRNLLVSPDASTTALQVNLTRDEHYFELLRTRERLREKRQREGLTTSEQETLARVEADFREYATVVQERERAVVEAVRRVLDRHRAHATIFLGGVPMIAADMIRFIQSDLLIFGSGVMAFIVLLLAAFFRRKRWVVLPLTTCLFASVAMTGYLAWIDWRLTVISSNFLALLLIITLAITIHLVVRYRELLAEDPDASQESLVTQTVVYMAKPCLYTSLTTLVAFASLVVSDIRPVIDFGWMMTIGVVLALIMAFLVLPAGLMLLPKYPPTPTGGPGAGLTLRFAKTTHHFGGSVLLVSALLLGLSAVGISRLQVENRFIDYFDPDTEIYQGMETIDRELGGTIPLEILIEAEPLPDPMASLPAGDDPFADDFGDDFADDFANGAGEGYTRSAWFNRAGLSRLESIHDWLEAQPEIGKVMSLATLYKVTRDLLGGEVDDIQLALVQTGLPAPVRDQLIAPYLDDSRHEARIVLRAMETSKTLRRDELLNSIRHTLTQDFGIAEERLHLTGMLVLYNNMLQSLYRSQILTLGFVFVAIMAMFLVLFRSLRVALIAITPNVLAAGIVLGGMGWAGVPLDMMTITIAAITIGIGVDDTIHYVHRFKREFARDRDYLATMYRCHGSIGKAMYYTSITIILGFSTLALSNFTPTIYFGLLTAFAMLAALIGAMLLLPKLILMFRPFGPEATAGEE